MDFYTEPHISLSVASALSLLLPSCSPVFFDSAIVLFCFPEGLHLVVKMVPLVSFILFVKDKIRNAHQLTGTRSLYQLTVV